MKIDPFWVYLPIQIGLAAILLPAFLLAPPAHGRILLVPVLPGSGSHLAADMVARGARLVAQGPTGGSLVIDGGRDRIMPRLLQRGVIPMSTVLIDCGAAQETV